MLNNRTLCTICPKTGMLVSLTTEYLDPKKSLNDKISKSDLECSKNCDYDPCPLIDKHNAIY